MVTQLNIVVVEDNDELRAATVDALRHEGHKVLGLDCAEAMPEQAALTLVDLVIIDLNLPGEDGLSLAQRIRHSHPEVGIIITTARSESSQRQEGYTKGADIYMTKPVALAELSAAILSLGRRLRGGLAVDSLVLSMTSLTLQSSHGVSLGLTSTEATLLAAFSLSSDRRLEKWQLIEVLEKDTAENPLATIELVIVRLRKKIRQLGINEPSIKVIRNWGYQFCLPITVLSS
jgi:DNA-binding response OmpR family regulator